MESASVNAILLTNSKSASVILWTCSSGGLQEQREKGMGGFRRRITPSQEIDSETITRCKCNSGPNTALTNSQVEAQQRYFSYRAILVATVSQKFFVLVLMGIALLSRARYTLQNGVSHRRACVKLRAKRGAGVSHQFGGLLTSLQKCRAIRGIAAIASQYHVIWGHSVCNP